MPREHTPGEWRAVRAGGDAHGRTIRSDNDGGVYIALVPSERKDFRENARLIASAPELLEAAKAVTEAAEGPCLCGDDPYGPCPYCDAFNRLAGAIAKATGEDDATD